MNSVRMKAEVVQVIRTETVEGTGTKESPICRMTRYWTLAIVFLGCVVMIICSHSGVDAKIHADRMAYEAIIKQVESIDSEYEDKSKVEVYQKVYDWNADVYSARYWAKSPWTNWFYSKKCVDSLKEIDLTDYEKEAR